MLPNNLYTLEGCILPTIMNDWTRFTEKWFNDSQIAFADYEFDIMKNYYQDLTKFN